MLHSEYHNNNPKNKQTRQFFPSPEQFDFWGYVSIAYQPRFEPMYTFLFSYLFFVSTYEPMYTFSFFLSILISLHNHEQNLA